MDMMAVEKIGKVELVPLAVCMYCRGQHLPDDCPDKYDCFALTYNDEKLLAACGIFYPRFVGRRFVTDPYQSEEIC